MNYHIKKPGYMKRAFIIWAFLNIVLLATMAAIMWIVGPLAENWYVMVPLLIGVIVSEWIIMAETIAPIISEWIKQEELVAEGEKPSWERDHD